MYLCRRRGGRSCPRNETLMASLRKSFFLITRELQSSASPAFERSAIIFASTRAPFSLAIQHGHPDPPRVNDLFWRLAKEDSTHSANSLLRILLRLARVTRERMDRRKCLRFCCCSLSAPFYRHLDSIFFQRELLRLPNYFDSMSSRLSSTRLLASTRTHFDSTAALERLKFI